MKALAAIIAVTAGLLQSAIQVDVNLQQIVVSVHDKYGKPVKNLQATDFIVEEDGKPQTIAHFAQELDVPVSIGLLIDKSASMTVELPNAAAQAQHLLDSTKSKDEFLVMTFDTSLHVLQEFTADREAIARSIHTGPPASGKTFLVECVVQALEKMNRSRYGARSLVVFTDGFNTNGFNRAAIEADIVRREIPIYAVQVVAPNFREGWVSPGAAEPVRPSGASSGLQSVLKMMVEVGGGRSLLSIRGDKQPASQKESDRVAFGHDQNATETERMTAFTNDMLSDIRSQYSLGYYPSGASDRSRSSGVAIKVRTVSDAYKVHVRASGGR